jgi:hypothetical protein
MMGECTHDWYIADAGTAECCNCKVRYASAQLLLNQTQAELKLAQSFSHWESVTVDKLRAELLTATQAVFVTARERQEFKAELNRIRPAAQAVVANGEAGMSRVRIEREDYDNLVAVLE